MALPNSHMSVTLALSSGLFFRRAEAAAKGSPGTNTLPDVTIPFGGTEVVFSDIVMQPSGAFFFTDGDGAVFLDLSLKLQGSIGTIILDLQGAYLRLRLNATTANEKTAKLTLSYEQLVIPDAGELTPEQEADMKESISSSLAGTEFPISIEALVAEERVLAGEPELVLAEPSSSGIGSTVVLGLEIEDDPDVDRDDFLAAFGEDPLRETGQAWRLDIDSELMRQRVAQELEETDFTEDAEGGIPGWISTESTRALWTGDPMTGNLFFQQPYLEEHYPEHAVWFFLEGYKKAGLGIAVNIYAAGYGDFGIDEEERAIQFSYEIYAAGYGIIPLPLPDEDAAPLRVADAEVADRLLATETGFDVNRFFLGGVDEHPGIPGSPQISVPTALDVSYDIPVSHGCRTIAFSAKGDGTATEEFAIANVGEAPLWVSGFGFENDDGSFSVQYPSGLELHEIEPGKQAFQVAAGSEVPIRVILSPDDHDEHTADLVMRCNDFDSPRVKIALTGHIEEYKPDLARKVPCVRKPELIPPQEWFEGLFELIHTLDDLVKPGLDVDDELELSFMGLSQQAEIDILDGEGRWLGTAEDYGNVRHVSLPVGKERGFRLQTTARVADLELHLSISHTQRLGEYRLDDKPRAVAENGWLVALAGRHHVSILSLADPEKPRGIAVLELGGVESLEMQGSELLARTSEETLEFFSLEDPHQPRHLHRMEVRGARVHFAPRGFALETPEGTRLYSTAASGRPRLDRELPARSALPSAFLGRTGANRHRDRSWGTSPYLSEGRLSQGRFVLELASETREPTLRILTKVPSEHVFDVANLEKLLKPERRRAARV